MATKKPQPAYLTQPQPAIDLDAGEAFLQSIETATQQPAEQPRTFLGTVGDVGLSMVKGAVAVPEAAIGLADLATGGRAGQAAEALGIRTRDAREVLDSGYSAAQKRAFNKVQNAQGLIETALEALKNPSVIGHSVLESLPLMGAGGVVGRGAAALAPRAAGAAGAVGEGTMAAGSAAEQIRQQTPDGRLTGEQAALAGASGLATGLLGYGGAKFANSSLGQRLGIADVDTWLAGAQKNPTIAAGLTRRVLGGVISEGLIEELPQSVSEQVLQNLALGKPLDEGVDQAAVLGFLSGGAMGGAFNALRSGGAASAPAAQAPAPGAPPVSPQPTAGAPAPEAPVATQPAAPIEAGGRDPLADRAMHNIEQLAARDFNAIAGGRIAAAKALEEQAKARRAADYESVDVLKKSGNLDAAATLKASLDKQVAQEITDPELQLLGAVGQAYAGPDFQTLYRQKRGDGGSPADAAGHAATLSGFLQLARHVGMSDKAIAKTYEKAQTLDMGEMPQYLERAMQKLADRGFGKPINDIGRALELHRDAAIQAATDALLREPAPAPKAAAPAAGTAAAAPVASTAPTIDAGAHAAAVSPLNDRPEPTKAQILGGNAALGHAKLGKLGLSIENPAGTVREDKHNDPPKWRTPMVHGYHYGYVKRTEAADSTVAKKQGIDVFVKEGLPEDYDGPVYVVDQVDKDGTFDEHKAIVGPESKEQASDDYLKHYEAGWHGLRAITEFASVDAFNQWAKDGKKTDPADPSVPVKGTQAQAAAPAAADQGAEASSEGTGADPRGSAAGAVPGGGTAAVAIRQQLFAVRDGKKFPVDSIEDASNKWAKFRDETGAGGSQIGNGFPIVDQDGKEVARISYNGNVWGPGEAKPGDRRPPLLIRKNTTGEMVPAGEDYALTQLGFEKKGDAWVLREKDAAATFNVTKVQKGWKLVRHHDQQGSIAVPSVNMGTFDDAQAAADAYAQWSRDRVIAQQFPTEPRSDGTLKIEGDPAAIKQQLTAAGVPESAVKPAKGGVVVGKTQAEKAKKAVEPPRSLTVDGRATDGKPINPGDTFRTASGRTTTEYPKQKAEKYATQWLIDNATAEARSRSDDFNARSFSAEKPGRDGALPPASRESMLEYLFGEQPAVRPSILKPLVAGATHRTSPSQQSAQSPVTIEDSGSATPRTLPRTQAQEATPQSDMQRTISDMLKEAGTKGFWFGVLRRKRDGEAFDVKVVPWPSPTRGDWGYEFWSEGKKGDGIPFPTLKSSTTLQELQDILLGYMNADEDGAFSMDQIGVKQAALVQQRAGAAQRQEDAKQEAGAAEVRAMRKARGDEQEHPWDDTDLADYRRMKRLQDQRFKTASDEKLIGLLEQRIKGRPDKWKVGDGVSYKVTAGGVGMQTNRGFRIIAIDPETKTATVRSVADTGLTSSGGNNDRIGDTVLAIGELARDRKYDAPAAAAPAAPEAKPKPTTKPKKTDYDKRLDALEDYFAPGNIVTSYGGHDRVMQFKRDDGHGGWTVQVHAVVKQGEQWVDDPKDNRDRWHATWPDARNLAKGPVVRAQPTPVHTQEDTEPANTEDAGGDDRDHFTLQRLNRDTGEMESQTFTRGEYVRASLVGSDQSDHGEIDGISHAKREFSVNGLWHPFGAAYKAERPPVAKPKDAAPLSKVVDAVNKKHADGLGPADAVSPLEAVKAVMLAVYEGTASVEDYRAGYQRAKDAQAVKADLAKLTKPQLMGTFGIFRDGKKDEMVDMAYNSLLRGFAMGKQYGPNSYMMTRGGLENYEKQRAEALDALVEGQTTDDLAAFAAERKRAKEESAAQRTALLQSIENPKTLEDFRNFMRAQERDGKTYQQARMMLTPEQRAAYDELSGTESRGRRTSAKDEQRTAVRVAGQVVDGDIIATKHTKKGHDLFVVKLSERVSREDYETLNTGAKRIGGYYSSYRGGGAIAGFQFTTREQAEAFVKLAGGDNTDAVEAAKERRDAFEDDRSQTAAERLTEMADRLEERADESLAMERKANTERRARFAASAEASARADKAMAKTMRNIAGAITSGTAKFLDRVRQKVQVELLQTYVVNAKDAELRSKYDSYAEQEKRKGQPPTIETADYAEFPSYTAYRSDLASLGRQLLEVEGTKLLGQRLMKVADDVSDAFTAWVKEPGNSFRVSGFSNKETGARAAFPSKDVAERAIARSGYKGKAIPWSIKRGEWTVIMSPSEAIARGIWTGDGDKRITLSNEFGAELVEKMGRANRRGARVSVPWQFERAYERLKALTRMGIETAPEFRAALREFIGLREQAAEADRVKMLERAMVGRAKDGLDFFPTPESVADEMVAAAGIEPNMAVLEPSAGMGHIADRIRAAGAEPDVIELDTARRELLQEKGYHLAEVNDFMNMEPRKFFTWGDVFRAPDGTEGVMQGHGGMGSNRVTLLQVQEDGSLDYRRGEWYDRTELVGVRHRGVHSGYDRIVMNPPFSDGRDIEHVKHAFTLLKPGGRLVALMGESAFTNQNKRATEFREWLESVGGTDEKLPEGTFNDPSLPVNTGANARMVVIDKPTDAPSFSRSFADRYTPDSKEALRDMETRVDRAAFRAWLDDMTGDKDESEAAMRDDDLRLDYLNDYLGEEHNITVRDDGRAEFWRLTPDVRRIIGDREVVLLHHTASGIDAKVRKEGLRPGKKNVNRRQRNAVFLTTESSGPVVRGYHEAARQTHGGDHITYEAVVRIVDLSPDPDDADIRSGATQFIVDSVPPENILREGPAPMFRRSWERAPGLTRDTFRTAMAEAFGEKVAEALEAKGVVVPLADQTQLPEHVVPFLRSGDIVYGFYDPKTNRTYAVLSNLDAGMVKGLALHEIGVHYGFKAMLGDEKYRQVLRQVDLMHASGNEKVRAARAEAKANSVRDSQVAEETLAYLVQNAPELGPIRSVIAAIKAWLYREFGIGEKYLTVEDLAALARAAVKHSARAEPVTSRTAPAFARGKIVPMNASSSEQKLAALGYKVETGNEDEGGWIEHQDGTMYDWNDEAGRFEDEDGNPLPKEAAEIAQYIGNVKDGFEVDEDVQGVANDANIDPFEAGSRKQRDPRNNSAFRRWFGDSKVVDADGRPLVVYHGTNRVSDGIGRFDGLESVGWFSESPGLANIYAAAKIELDDASVYPVYLSVKNPLVLDFDMDGPTLPAKDAARALGISEDEISEKDADEAWEIVNWYQFMDAAQAAGYDGVRVREKGHWSWAPIKPNQIKSATGNRGTFDGNDSNIMFSRTMEPTAIAAAARATFNDLTSTSHTFNSWWHRTVGTQYHKAQKDRDFRRVFDASQAYLADVSRFANESADLARDLLPKLENMRDVFKDVPGLDKNRTSAADVKAAAQPVFEGTIGWVRDDNGRATRLVDAEAKAESLSVHDKAHAMLKAGKLAPNVLAMWQGMPLEHFESAVDTRYREQMLKPGVVFSAAELKQHFKLTEKQAGLYRQARAAVDKSLDDLGTSTIAKLLSAAEVESQEIDEAIAAGDHRTVARLMDELAEFDETLQPLANQVAATSLRVEVLKRDGYAPLKRFGQYAVSLRDDAGNLEEFYLFESEREANAKVRELAGKGDVSKSVMSQQDYKLLQGISPESLELFGDILEQAGVLDPRDEVFQTYLREAIAQRSALKRFIHREGYPGFSMDLRRVLADFLTSNARLSSKNHHFGEMLQAAEAVPKSKGDVRDEAVNLVKYVQEPTEEAAMIRGLLFVQYIGGSVASAIVNMTQTLTMTYPYLSQFTNPAKAMATVTGALKAALGKPKGALADDLKKAEQSGVVSPQEIHHLNAEAGRMFSAHPAVQRAMFLWGSFFSLAEQFNRRVAFIAAWETAKARGDADPYAFAVKAVEETQGVYNRGNRPNWARGAVGATLFTFKQFSISYLEFLARLPNRERAVALAVLLLAAGGEGMPFSDDLDDIIDTIAQRMGYALNSKEAKRKFLVETLGMNEAGAEFVLKGVSAIPGAPIDISARMGMANLIPATGVLRKDVKDHSKDVIEIAGPVGSAAKDLLDGEWRPLALRNLAKSADMFASGQYRDSKGRRVVDVDAVDALWKAVGFQPSHVAQESLRARVVSQNIALVKQVETEIADEWARGRVDGDDQAVDAAKSRLAEWNTTNPSERIVIKPRQIITRMRELKRTREERIVKRAPPELRASVAAQLQ